jgi:hypothetical protein
VLIEADVCPPGWHSWRERDFGSTAVGLSPFTALGSCPCEAPFAKTPLSPSFNPSKDFRNSPIWTPKLASALCCRRVTRRVPVISREQRMRRPKAAIVEARACETGPREGELEVPAKPDEWGDEMGAAPHRVREGTKSVRIRISISGATRLMTAPLP